MIKLLVLVLSLSIQAAEVYSTWTQDYTKHVSINCYHRDGDLCAQICEAQSKCIYPERPCRNCMSSSIMLTHLFKDLNLYYDRGSEVDHFEFSEFLESRHFSSFSALSLMNYNSGAPHLSRRIEKTFKRLCPGERTRYPTIFFSIETFTRELREPQYVACNDDSRNPRVYRLFRHD